MYTQFHQPASGSQERGRYLGGALMKNWTWPKGSGGRPSPIGLSSPGGPTFLIYLFHCTTKRLLLPECMEIGRPCKESQNPDPHPHGSVAGCRPSEQGTPRDGKVGTAQPPSTFLPLKHKEDEAENCQSWKFLWLLTTQVCTLCGSWVAEPYLTTSPVHPDLWPDCGLWLPEVPPLCIGFSSISNYS